MSAGLSSNGFAISFEISLLMNPNIYTFTSQHNVVTIMPSCPNGGLLNPVFSQPSPLAMGGGRSGYE